MNTYMSIAGEQQIACRVTNEGGLFFLSLGPYDTPGNIRYGKNSLLEDRIGEG